MTAAISGSMEDEMARWVAERDETTIGKLAAAGLVPKRESATLAACIDE